MMRRRHRVIVWCSLLVYISGCGKFLGNLRRDLDDSDPAPQKGAEGETPGVGGRWSERGYLGPQGSEPAMAQGPSSGTQPTLEPQTRRQYKNGARATRDDFIDQSQEEGSLWASSGQTNYYFTKNKVRSPGDLINVNIENDLFRDIAMEIKRTLSPKEKIKELDYVQDRNREKVIASLEAGRRDTVTTSAAAAPQAVPNPAGSATPQAQASAAPAATVANANPTPSSTPLSPDEIDRLVPRATMDDVDIYPSIEFKAGENMMGEILERYPNGNYKVRTVKRIPYKKGPPRIVSIVGIVKGSDINDETDTISSSKLYEYRIEVAH